MDNEDDARLIAAAPELLESLREILSRYTGLVDSGDCGSWDSREEIPVQQAYAAIAKAEGR